MQTIFSKKLWNKTKNVNFPFCFVICIKLFDKFFSTSHNIWHFHMNSAQFHWFQY